MEEKTEELSAVIAEIRDRVRARNPNGMAAFNASRADQESDFKASIAQLRTACNTCHAAYMKMN